VHMHFPRHWNTLCNINSRLIV